MILDGKRLDMGALAAELGVNRTTLYRWFGTREDLIVEVCWNLTESTIIEAWRDLPDNGGPRVPETMRRWLRATIDTPGIRRLLHGESEFAMRLFTLRSGGFQPRLLALVRGLLLEDVVAGRMVTSLPIDELAYTVIRICESYLYLPAITGESTDPDIPGRILSVLVTGPADG